MKKKIFLIILTVCLLMVGVVGCNNSQQKPAEVFTDAMVNTYLHYNFSNDISIKFNFNEDTASENEFLSNITDDSQSMVKFMNSMLDKSEIKYGMNLVTKENNENTFKTDFHMGLYYDNADIISGIVNFEPWQVNMWVPQLFSKAFVYDVKEDLGQNFEFQKYSSIDYSKYVQFILQKLKYFENIKDSSNKYRKLFVEYFNDKVKKLEDDTVTVIQGGKNKEIPVTRYKVAFDVNDAYDINVKLLQLAKKDESFKKYVIEVLTDFKDLVIEEKDCEKFDIDESDFKDTLEEEISKINTDWKKYIDNSIKQIESAKDQTNDSLNASSDMINKIYKDMIFFIDNDKNIRKIEIKLDIDKINEVQKDLYNSQIENQNTDIKLDTVQDSIKGLNICFSFIFNAYDDDVKINIPNSENKINVVDLIDDRDLQSGLIDELGTNLGSLLSSDVVENLLKDIKENAKILPEDESNKIINDLDNQFNQFKFVLPLLMQSFKLKLGY